MEFQLCITFLLMQSFVNYNLASKLKYDDQGRVHMGPQDGCDDGKKLIEIDWNPTDEKPYTCNQEKILPNSQFDDNFSGREPNQFPYHVCLPEKIDYFEIYQTKLPSVGRHRPVWPTYGTYRFIPAQRWLHGLEHGAIVALYHPCANDEQVKLFTSTVRKCLRRHIISPNSDVSTDRPFLLLAWEFRLEMNRIDESKVKKFIKKHALKGPEVVPSDGAYDAGLLEKAEEVSGFDDTNLCP